LHDWTPSKITKSQKDVLPTAADDSITKSKIEEIGDEEKIKLDQLESYGLIGGRGGTRMSRIYLSNSIRSATSLGIRSHGFEQKNYPS
jgi:hypothetical protein